MKPKNEEYLEFAKWVTNKIFDDNGIEDFDFELFSELACRKLAKLGLVKKTDSEWIKVYVPSISVFAENGVNNIISDCGGDVNVSYKDTIQHYIDSRI